MSFETFLEEKKITKGSLTEEQTCRLLADYSKLKFIIPTEESFSIDVVDSFNKEFLKKYSFLPIFWTGNDLEVVTSSAKTFNLEIGLKNMFPNLQKVTYNLTTKTVLDSLIIKIIDEKVLIACMNISRHRSLQ